ncbi:hypothetical protein LTR66_017010 [Elasticomyces elasticus]|nr:hypothetical protein LTR66_017010 [Elasticomyces elasticus]
MIIGNEFSARNDEEPILELLGWDHRIIDDTEKDLGFDVHPLGWKVVLTQRVPKLAKAAVPAMFNDLAKDYDWALHPGGATVISGVQQEMGLTENHLRASYEVYMAHGNSSSATVFSVIKRLLEGPTTEHIISCAFGPGIAVEMMAFRRCGDQTPSTGSPAETLVAEDVD